MNLYSKTAHKAALAAGRILLDNFGKVKADEIRQKSVADYISYVDETSEKKIIEIIHSDFPDHGILAEESGSDKQQNDYRWIIDPLDGTTNYLHSIPVFAVSIALEFKGEIICGVIYNPVANELFWAEKGGGSFLNNEPIRVSGTQGLSDSFIATGFPFKIKHLLKKYLKVFEAVFRESVGARRLGAAAIDLAYVACGRFDGFWEIGLNPWDIAAGIIIIEEAGGLVTDFWGTKNNLNCSYLIASNSIIHNSLGEIIRVEFPFYKSIAEGHNNE